MNIHHHELIGLHCDVVSAERAIFCGSVKFVSITGCDGELGIARGHSPLLTAIPPGELKLVDRLNKAQFFYVEGGYLEVQPDCVTILADVVIRAQDLDMKKAEQAKRHAEKLLSGSRSSKHINFSSANHELVEAMAKMHVIEAFRKSLLPARRK